MSDPITHAGNSAPILVAIGIAITAVFQIQALTFLIALVGAGCGLAFRPAPPEAKSKIDLALRFFGNAGYVLITTICTAFAMFWLKKYFPDAEYPVAFFSAIVMMVYRELLIDLGGKLLSIKFQRIK
jgi:hypothetical protein